jgi:hypothetical protein
MSLVVRSHIIVVNEYETIKPTKSLNEKNNEMIKCAHAYKLSLKKNRPTCSGLEPCSSHASRKGQNVSSFEGFSIFG